MPKASRRFLDDRPWCDQWRERYLWTSGYDHIPAHHRRHHRAGTTLSNTDSGLTDPRINGPSDYRTLGLSNPRIIDTLLFCFVFCLKLCTIIRTLRWAVLTVLWIGFSFTGLVSLCVDLFVFICVYFVCFCFILCVCCITVSTVGWTWSSWWDWSLILTTYLPSVL